MLTKIRLKLCFALFFFIGSMNAQADINQELLFSCMAEVLKTAPENMTTDELRERCHDRIKSPIGKRTIFEKQASTNPFAILPHKPNYILPFTYSKVRAEPYGDLLQGETLDNAEVKFPLNFLPMKIFL